MYSKVILSITLFFTLLVSFQPLIGANSDSLQEIEDMTKLLEQENLSVKSWEVTLKETIGKEDISEVMNKIQAILPEAKVVKEQTDEVNKYIISTAGNQGIQEKVVLLEPLSQHHPAEMNYIISSNIWNNKVHSQSTIKLNKMLNSVFTSNVKKVGCVTTHSSDIIDSVYVIKNVMKKLDVQPAGNELQEAGFHVFSGYTPQWSNAIPISDKPINFQMAAREGLGGKTTITIGTPILINEY